MKHLPFQSNYLQDFEVVEERHGNVRLFPHTEQLPRLLRAVNLEFTTGLPGYLARVDHRADGFRKITRRIAALLFCTGVNAARSDDLRLLALLDPNLVARVAVVQQITTTTRLGNVHRFRFYAGDDFFPEIYLSGKRVAFAEHVLQRYSSRVRNNAGENLSRFLLTFFGSLSISLPVGSGRAFIVPYLKSFLAYTYKEMDDEYFITTCLTVKEINFLDLELPPQAFNLHYHLPFTRPRLRHWRPTERMLDAYRCWENKVLVPETPPPQLQTRWHQTAALIKDGMKMRGHGPDSRLFFADNIPGPCPMELRPGQTEPQFDELKSYKETHPEYDWDAILARRDARRGGTSTVLTGGDVES